MKGQGDSYRYLKIIVLAIVCCHSVLVFSQLNIANVPFYNQAIDRLLLSDTTNTYLNTHTSAKPILSTKTKWDSIVKKDKTYQYWVTRKLFKEHFLVFEGKDYWCAVDPVVDLEVGANMGGDSIQRLFWNTRGIRIQAQFFDNFAIETKVYETQAVLLGYQNEYVEQHGELVPNFNNTLYKQQNAVIPGYSRTKPFGSRGYDFAFAEGYVSYSPKSWVNIQLGNGNQFIGQGHRSLLLSDFTTNYPYLKPEFMLFNGRLQYALTFAGLQNLYRLPFHSTPEANFERNIGTFHYLEYAVTKDFQIGFFEGGIWKRLDSTGTHPINPMILNPIIGTNAIFEQSMATRYNSILGLNARYQLWSNIIYGQAVLDHEKVSAWQLGVKSYDLILKGLDFQLEYNQSMTNTTLSADERLNYGHSNLPLAHPYTAGFKEGIFKINYRFKDCFISNHLIVSSRAQSDSSNIGVSVLMPTATNLPAFDQTILYNQTEFGYQFNKNYNLQVYLGYLYRQATGSATTSQTDYVYFGVRTRLKNKTLDW